MNQRFGGLAKLLGILISFFGVAAGLHPIVFGQAVHAIMCFPTEYRAKENEADNIWTNSTSYAGAAKIQHILSLLPEGQVEVTELTGEQYDGAVLLRTIRELRLQPEDSLLVYVVAHGSFDPEHRYVMHVGNTDAAGLITHHMLSREVRKHDIRLGVLIGESCGSIAPHKREEVENIVGRNIPQAATARHRGDSESRLVRNLFLGQRGFVDFTSARAGEGAHGSLHEGPDFTFCFHQTIVQRSSENLDWDQVFSITKAKLISKSNGKQVPVAMATPSIVSRNKALLEISLVGVGGRVQIKTVRSGGKGFEAGLQEGDVVVSVNGIRIQTTGQYLKALDQATASGKIKFAIARNGQTHEIEVEP